MKKGKEVSFILLGLNVAILIVATVLEKFQGTEVVRSNIYNSPGFALFWIFLVMLMVQVFFKQKLFRKKIVFAMHFSFVFILLGALLSWGISRQGTLHLRQGIEIHEYKDQKGHTCQLPFSLDLEDFTVVYYSGTSSIQDYISHLLITDKEEKLTRSLEVSMNKIGKYKGYRFYQSGYDQDGDGTLLSIQYNPLGIIVTYFGYLLLIISMCLMFFYKESDFRKIAARLQLKPKTVLMVLMLAGTGQLFAASKPKVLPKDIASEFCDMNVEYNGRICPLQTVAYDFTLKLYGKTSYKGFNAEQVFTGWLFYFSSWRKEPMLEIKGDAVRSLLGISTGYACFDDYFTKEREYKLAEPINKINIGKHFQGEKYYKKADEKYNIIGMLYSGDMLQVFPAQNNHGNIQWYASGMLLPETLKREQWVFIRKSLDYAREMVLKKSWNDLSYLLDKIKIYQKKESGNSMPSSLRLDAEKVYNSFIYGKFLSMVLVSLGIISFFIVLRAFIKKQPVLKFYLFVFSWILILAFIYESISILLRGIVSQHLPLSNGYETMLFMSWCSLFLTIIFYKRLHFIISFGFLSAGFSLMVAMFSKGDPGITHLVPVLSSPLLSIHVMSIMLSYTLLMFVMFIGITALFLSLSKHNYSKDILNLQLLSRLILFPAIFCLVLGVIFGSVWANVSWGRYWGWDPKEVWALITLLIYSFALHSKFLKRFRKPLAFHMFTILAFLSVLFTYFGVNFLLGGIHSYGG